MKRINKLNRVTLILIMLVSMLVSCNKNKVEPSKPTYLPTLTLNGDAVMVLDEGTAYAEPGAVATENGSPIDVVIDGTVDETTPGVYPISYTATNADGFDVSTTRIVVVVPVSAIEANDIVGDFTLSSPARPSPIPTMTVSRIGTTNVYFLTSIYGSNGSNQLIAVPAYVYTTDGIVYNVLDASFVGGNIASGGTATWNSVTRKLACLFQIASVGPGSNFSRTWQQN